jgi:drug/metabolite transporter (DMT)-like permease
MKSETSFVRVGFLSLCLIWGSTWLAIKIGLESIPPFYSVVFRFLIAAFLSYGLLRMRGLSIPRDRASWNLFVTIGLLSFGLPFSIIYWSGQYLPSGLMSILFAVFPFMVAILSHKFLPNEPLNVFKVIGIVIGFSGIIVIFSEGLSSSSTMGQFQLLGIVGIVVGTILQAGGLMVLKRKGKDVDPLTLNFSGMLIGAIPVAVMAILFERLSDIRVDAKSVGSILYLSTFGSVVTFAVYFWMLKRVEAVYLSFLTFVTPVVAVFLGAVVLGEKLEPNTFLGASLVLLGVLVGNGKGFIDLMNSDKISSPMGEA